MPTFDQAQAVAYLTAWADAFEQHYRGGVADFMKRHGKTTKMIPMRKQRVFGDSIEYTVKSMANRSAQVQADPVGDLPAPSPGEYVTFTVTFDYDSIGVNNDFGVFEVVFRTSIYDIWKKSDRTFKDNAAFVQKDVQEGIDDVKEVFAKYLHLPTTGVLASANNIGDTDNQFFATTDGGYVAGDTEAMLQLTDSAIGRIGDGQILDVFDSTNSTLLKTVRVTYVHPFEQTITIQVHGEDDSGGIAQAQNLDNVDNEIDTLSSTVNLITAGSVDGGPSGTLAALFDTTVDYYGRARQGSETGATANYVAKNRILAPIRIDASAGGANVNLTADLFRRVGESVGWLQGAHNAVGQMMMVMSRFEYRQIAAFTRDEGITMTPALQSDVGRQLNRAFGFDGLTLHDPNLGTQLMIVDDFALPGQIDFLNRSQWEQASPIDGGFRMMPGELGGIWTRQHQNTVLTQPHKFYQANGILLAAFVCTYPKGQIRLEGLTTA